MPDIASPGIVSPETVSPGLVAGRLGEHALIANFADAHPPLPDAMARIEADRCLYCFDAPCIEACPTGIDVPGFIGRIATGDLRGAAAAILDRNIMGGSCARVCPTDILCEGSCVRVKQGERPVAIGALQRHAVDWQMRRGHPYARAASRGTRIAVVGAGPAGLACAHRLAMRGHDVDVFDARDKPGGLNEYGIAAYKVADDFARSEVEFLLQIGGITLRPGRRLGRDMTLADLRASYDAVFLGIGLAAVRALGIAGEDAPGCLDAVEFIEAVRQSDPRSIPVGARVVVIGGGNTAIDAAVQARRLGADEVTLVYRRGPEHMTATPEEQAWARRNDVSIRTWATPAAIGVTQGCVDSITFMRGAPDAQGRPVYDRGTLVLRADMILKAIGQLYEEPGAAGLAMAGGRITVDGQYRTSMERVFAGGDCTSGMDLTVAAVRDGRDAASAIDAMLQERGR